MNVNLSKRGLTIVFCSLLAQFTPQAGHLNNDEQQKITSEDDAIVTRPANPEVVYVPAYDPWLVDGAPNAAYSVDYRSSEVMTFVADRSGTIYEKHFGPETTKLAQAMTVSNLDSSWHKTE